MSKSSALRLMRSAMARSRLPKPNTNSQSYRGFSCLFDDFRRLEVPHPNRDLEVRVARAGSVGGAKVRRVRKVHAQTSGRHQPRADDLHRAAARSEDLARTLLRSVLRLHDSLSLKTVMLRVQREATRRHDRSFDGAAAQSLKT